MRTMEKGSNVLSWSELLTTDYEESVSFYKSVFGWDMIELPGRDEQKYALIKNRVTNTAVGGIAEMPLPLQQIGLTTHWANYINVDDLNNTISQAIQFGARLLLAPMEIPNIGEIATLEDSRGALTSLIKYTRSIAELRYLFSIC